MLLIDHDGYPKIDSGYYILLIMTLALSLSFYFSKFGSDTLDAGVDDEDDAVVVVVAVSVYSVVVSAAVSAGVEPRRSRRIASFRLLSLRRHSVQ